MLNFIFILIFTFLSFNFIDTRNVEFQNHNIIIVDCNYSFGEATSGKDIPESILKKLALIDVEYFSFDDKLHRGQIVVNKSVVKDIKEIFEFIKRTKFPINKVIPISKYNWSDDSSMSDNNTTAFNYRKVKGQKVLSAHSYGLAIDINPLQNPHIKGKKVNPPNAVYNIEVPGTIVKGSQLVKEFRKYGWTWGGYWKSSKDYQHFEKKL